MAATNSIMLHWVPTKNCHLEVGVDCILCLQCNVRKTASNDRAEFGGSFKRGLQSLNGKFVECTEDRQRSRWLDVGIVLDQPAIKRPFPSPFYQGIRAHFFVHKIVKHFSNNEMNTTTLPNHFQYTLFISNSIQQVSEKQKYNFIPPS